MKKSDMYVKIPHTLYSVSLGSDSADFLKNIWHIYAPYIFAEGISDMDIYASFGNGVLSISWDSHSIQLTLDQDNAVEQICALFQCRQYTEFPWNLYHGTAFHIKGKTIVFLGESGAGKTTAVTYLTESQKDSIYLTEDILIIDCKSNCIVPYPRPLHLREGGVGLLRETYGIPLADAHQVIFHNYKRYILHKEMSVHKIYPVDGYIQLSRNRHAKDYCIEEIVTDKVKIFTANCYLPYNIHNNITCSVLLSGKAVLWKAQYADLADLSEMICDIMSL